MPDLVRHAQPVETVFDLLGDEENDMTAALGWGLTHSSPLLRSFVERVASGTNAREPIAIELQEHGQTDRGFTDIELKAPGIHMIVEAKRGWDPPGEAQLRRYEDRFRLGGESTQRFVVLTQNGADQVVRHRLDDWAPPEPIEVHVLGWSDLVAMAQTASHQGRLSERHIASELAAYLRGVADMRNTESNRVFVVSLSGHAWDGWATDLTPIDEVVRHRMYHYPAVGSWPKAPPNYMAFRYGSRLQSIHHVDDYEIVDTPYGHVPGAPNKKWDEPHFVLRLGPPILPTRETKTGPGIVRSGRVWVDIDLLLTAPTITEALTLTKARRSA